MQLSDNDLQQIDEAYIERLGQDSLRSLSGRLLLDLKESRERLKQNSRNSSLPPSREAPWEKPPARDIAAPEGAEPQDDASAHRGQEIVRNMLEDFEGVLMSDGRQAHRWLPRRLRFWAHLKRKAQGLVDPTSAVDGNKKGWKSSIHAGFDSIDKHFGVFHTFNCGK